MPAPAFVSATAHAANPTTAPSVTLPTTAANDILLLLGVNAGAVTAITPGGTYNGGAFASIDAGTWTTGWGGVLWSRCTGNHSGQTVTGVTVDSGSLLVIRISGAITTGNPIDVNVSGASVAAANGALAAFNTVVGNGLVCLCAMTDDNQVKSGFTKNAVAMSNLSLASSSGGGDSGVGFAASSQAAAGTTGAFAITEAAGTAQGKRLSAFSIIPAPLTATVNQASDTETAGATGRSKQLAIGQASDTETATATGRSKRLAIAQASSTETARRLAVPSGRATETDTAGTLAGTKKLAIAQASDTETAAALTIVQTGGGQTVAVAQASDTETAGATTSLKTFAIGQVADAETARALVAIDPILRAIAQVSDTETAGATTPSKKLAVAQASDTETAGTPTAIDPILRAIDQAVDTETARELTVSKVLSVGQPSSLETARAIAGVKTTAIAQTSELDSAPPITPIRSATIGLVTDQQIARALDHGKLLALGRASDLESALVVLVEGSGTVAVDVALETDSASALGSSKIHAVGLATDLQSALALVAKKTLALALAAETDSAGALTSERAATIAQAAETSEASGLLVFTTHTAGQALETDAAGLLVLLLPDPEEEEDDVVLFSITPNMSGFEDAQERLRSMMGVDITFYWPTTTEWPDGTALNPETGRPFDPTVTPTASGFASTSVRCSVVHRPIRGSVEDQQENDALGRMDAKNVGLIMSYGAFPSAATEFEWLDRRYKIVDHLRDALSTARRDLAFGEML